MNAKAKIIELNQVEREYGLKGKEAIIDHPKYGRILLCDGFGWMGELRGGMVRWEHGVAIKLKADDTFEVLEKEEQGNLYSIKVINRAIEGYDEDRPQMGWAGKIIESVAHSVGL